MHIILQVPYEVIGGNAPTKQYSIQIQITLFNFSLVSFSCTCSFSTLNMPWTEQKSGTLTISDIAFLFILCVLPGEAQMLLSNIPLS